MSCSPRLVRLAIAALVGLATAGCHRPTGEGVTFRASMPQAVIDDAPVVHAANPVPAPAIAAGEIRLPPGMGLPLVVRFEGRPSAAVVAATREAVAVWNAGLGEEVVTLDETARGQQVRVGVGLAEDDPQLVYGAARRAGPGDLWHIELSPQTPKTLLKGTVVHELGHMLGLSHNASASSVMYQRATGLSRPSQEDLRQARAGVEALKGELNTLLSGWRRTASR